MSPWLARRVGNRILCGRRQRLIGPYDCGGVLAGIILEAPLSGPEFEWPTLEPGTTEDPPGHVRLTTKAQRQLKENRAPLGRRKQEALDILQIPDWRSTARPPPWTRDCPLCGHANLVEPPACPPGPRPLPLLGVDMGDPADLH